MDVNTLNTILKSILPTFDNAGIEKVSNAVLATGVVQEDDLKWLVEEDIETVLPPALRRKLVGTFKSRYGIDFVVTSIAE